MKKKILYVILFLICFAWSLCGVVDAFVNTLRIEDLTMQERIMYEQMIFP